MCGIAGIYAYGDPAPPVARDELLRIRDAMAKRGPDGAGLWLADDARVGLAHRRLAIIDLSESGAQPMATADGRLRITFNGEIYNYRELRRELEGKGFVFRSRSDTEVLLHLYADRGPRMLAALRGMFAFALWDDAKRAMFLARDPLGVKPLYYADDGATLRAASQVKALVAGGAIAAAEDPAGHASFLVFGAVSEPFTLFRDVHALPAGSSLWADRRGVGRPEPYFRIADEFGAARGEPADRDPEEVRSRVADALADSVRAHLIADVPVGVFLSAGIDSGALVGFATQAGATKLATLTLGFREFVGTPADETRLAAVVARHFGTDHDTRWITQSDFEADLEPLLDAMDQPSIDGVNTYFVAKAAAAAGMKVALSGLGADEIFGGYPSFRDLPRLTRAFGWGRSLPRLGRFTRRTAAPFFSAATSPKFAGLVEYGGTIPGAYLLRRGLYMPWELARVMGPERARAGLEALQPIARLAQTIDGIGSERAMVAALELAWYMRCQLLRDADWAGMAHSLEIRVPYVDVVLLRALAPLIASRRPPLKPDLARAVPRGLPREVAARAKTGFETPVRQWIASVEPQRARERGLRGWSRFVLRRQSVKPRRVLISTLVPIDGGVAAMTQKVVEFLKRRQYDVALAYYMPYRLAPALSVPFWKLLWKRPSMREGRAFGGVPSYEIGVRLPELESVRCFPSKLWKAIVADFDYHVAVSGSALAALPIVFQKKPCLAWVATPYLEDKIDRARRFPWYRRLVDSLIDTPACRCLEREALRPAAVLALSDYTARALSRIEARVRMAKMPMPIDAALFHPTLERVTVANRIGFAGRFADPRKNMPLLFDALAACRARGVPVTCDLIGDEPTPEFAEHLRGRALADAVRFRGFCRREALIDFYNGLDVFVIASHQEGLGIVGLEAMACGCPVVATRCGGTEDYVKDGVNGFLVDFSAEQMARAILRILADSGLRRRLRSGALQTVRHEYSEERVEGLFWQHFERAFARVAA